MKRRNALVVAGVASVLGLGLYAVWPGSPPTGLGPPEPTRPSGAVSNTALLAQPEKFYKTGITSHLVGPGRQPGKLRTVATWVDCKGGATVVVKGYKIPPDRPDRPIPLRAREPHTSTEPTGRWQFDWDEADGMTTGDRVRFYLELRCGTTGAVKTFTDGDGEVP